MSGIAGVIHKQQHASKELLLEMARAMKHSDRARVDSWNESTVGFCRVHHEVTNAEAQPVFDAQRSKAFLLSGEFFGYDARSRELEASGGPFQLADNDAEFGLRLYESEGDRAFLELNGSFAFAVHDRASDELILVSDRFSSRPLFYSLTPQGSLVFGTQISAVLRSPEVPRETDERSMLELFNFQRILGTKTLNRAVSMLPPGSVLRYRDGQIRIDAYWEMDYRPEPRSEAEFVDEMAHVMRQASDRVTAGPHRYGVLLSAGLDSRMVLAACERDLQCYHFNDTRNHEWELVQELARIRGCSLEYLQRSRDHYIDLYEASIEIGGGMYSYNYAHTVGLFDEVRDHCDFMLHGFAPELYFRGTNLPHVNRTLFGQRYLIDNDWSLTKEGLPDKMVHKLKYSLAFQNPSQMFREPYRSRMQESLRESVCEIIAEAERHTDDIYDQYLWPDTFYHAKFPSFLFEASIRPFIGERSIVFDNDVLDLHLRMPLASRCNNRIWARAVRKLHPQIAAVPDANTGYSAFLPTPVRVGLDFANWSLRKLGIKKPPKREPGHATNSWPRFQELIQHHDGMRSLIERHLNDPECLDPEIFDMDRVHKMYAEHLTRESDFRHLLLMAVTFGGWNKLYGPGTAEQL